MKSGGKIVYQEEELFDLRHFNQEDIECRKLVENLSNQENVHKQVGVGDGDKQLWRQVEFKLPPGSIILRIDPGMKIPEGARLLETLLDQDGDELFETSETTNNQKQAWKQGWKGKLNQKHQVYIIGAKLGDKYQKFNNGNMRTKWYNSGSNYANNNPYSRGFFPGYFTNLISRSYNPYSRTGFYPNNRNNHPHKPGSDCDSHSTQSSFDIEI
jgi:hypothetical protein